MQTQLNVKMAFDCLDRNGWVYQTALNNFYQVKVYIATLILLLELLTYMSFLIPRLNCRGKLSYE